MSEMVNVCPVDGEPVVFTFEFPGAEYFCPACGWKGGVMQQAHASAAPELLERTGEVYRRYEADRAAREGRPIRDAEPEAERPVCSGCGKVAQGPMQGQKPAHWYQRTIGGVDEFACSRDCISVGTVAPW